MRNLTEKQKSILDFIEDFQERRGMPPTVLEISDHFGLKTSTAFAHLRALQRKKEISRSSKARSIVLNRRRGGGISTVPTIRFLSIPLLGRVNAGSATESPSEESARIDVPIQLLGKYAGAELFALEIQGESMRELGIFEGDVVVVGKIDQCRPGDIVVALVNGGENTVKSFFPMRDGRIELRPANPDFQSQIYDPDNVVLQGKVLTLLRKYS
ncbi:MAG: transcriptional repressor LexA [Victivallaceae bacterium]|nr:transcriptional repressor LexA [Victivallaceae bacterium]